MDRTMIEDDLRQAEDHVVLGQEHVDRQRELLAKLEQDGHPTERAVELLKIFGESLASHTADRDRLKAQLGALNNNAAERGPLTGLNQLS